jgi:hypothetical protein
MADTKPYKEVGIMKRLLMLALLAAVGALASAASGGQGDNTGVPATLSPAAQEPTRALGPLGYPSLTPEQLTAAHASGVLADPVSEPIGPLGYPSVTLDQLAAAYATGVLERPARQRGAGTASWSFFIPPERGR